MTQAFQNTGAGRTIAVSDGGVEVTEFDLSREKQAELLENGEKAVCEAYKVPYENYRRDTDAAQVSPVAEYIAAQWASDGLLATASTTTEAAQAAGASSAETALAGPNNLPK